MTAAVSPKFYMTGLGFVRQVHHQMADDGRVCAICLRDWLDIKSCGPSICKLYLE